jgi:glycogen operon protein
LVAAGKTFDVHRFVRLLSERRRLRKPDTKQRHSSLNQLLARAVKTWHRVKLGQPDWNSSSHSIALSAHLPYEDVVVHVIFNAYWEPLEFELPAGDCGHAEVSQ